MSGSEDEKERRAALAGGDSVRGPGTAETPAPRTSEIVWDDSKMASFYADVVNLQSTREQVYLFFGTNQTLSLGDSRPDGPMRIELNSRVILTPHATKRLLLALSDIIKKYESRFGELKI